MVPILILYLYFTLISGNIVSIIVILRPDPRATTNAILFHVLDKILPLGKYISYN